MFQGDVHIASRMSRPEKVQRRGQEVPKREILKGSQDQDHPKVISGTMGVEFVQH
jgi:hypothetical protein